MKFALLFLTVCSLAAASDKRDYQIGTFVSNDLAADGTYTKSAHCNDNVISGVTCSGTSRLNQVALYFVKTGDGTWTLETFRQASDTMERNILAEPHHLRGEKPNLLDALKSGDRVMFRVEKHKKIGGTDIYVFIPHADDPSKEDKFVGTFAPLATVTNSTDNVKAMCDSGKLTPEQHDKLCSAQQVQSQAITATATSLPTPEQARANATEKIETACGANSVIDQSTRARVCPSFCSTGYMSKELQTQYCKASTTSR